MSRIEDPLRELRIRYALTQEPSNELLCQAGCTDPYAWLDIGVFVGELGSQPRFSHWWLGMGHLHDSEDWFDGASLLELQGQHELCCLDRNPAWEALRLWRIQRLRKPRRTR